MGTFDLAFFVDVLIYDIREGSKLLREIVPRGYWANPGELPPATNFATLKQELMNPKRYHSTVPGREPAKPAAPVAPFDHLFMVMAVEQVLRPGQPARRLLDEQPIA